MLSLRSLAFILASAIRRARALSSAALHRAPDRISGRKMATKRPKNMATKRATNRPVSISVSYEQSTPSLGSDGTSRRCPVQKYNQRRFRTLPIFSAGEFAEEVGLVHPVLEGFAAVDEDDGDLVGELAAELFVGVHVDVLPVEAAAAMQFGERLFHDFAEVASFAGVDHDLAELGHGGECSKGGRVSASGLGMVARGDGES